MPPPFPCAHPPRTHRRASLLRDALASQASFGAAVAHLSATKTIMKQCGPEGRGGGGGTGSLHTPIPPHSLSHSRAQVPGALGAVGGRGRHHDAQPREAVDDSHGAQWGLWTVDVARGAWYRLVTNYDPWLPDPASDPVSAQEGVGSLPWLPDPGSACFRVRGWDIGAGGSLRFFGFSTRYANASPRVTSWSHLRMV